MNKSRLSLVISLAALLGGGLVLPNAASAHDRTPTFQVERGHHDHYDRHNRHHGDRTRHHNPQWYLQRHYEARAYGYRPGKRVRRHQQHKAHAHKHHRQYRDYSPVQHHREYSPVRLEIGYEIVL